MTMKKMKENHLVKNCNLTTCRYNENGKLKNEEIMNANTMLDFLEIAKKFDKTLYCVCGKSDCPVYVSETEEDANNFIAQHSHYDLLHIEIAN